MEDLRVSLGKGKTLRIYAALITRKCEGGEGRGGGAGGGKGRGGGREGEENQ